MGEVIKYGRDNYLVIPDETLEWLKPDLTPPPPSQLQLAIERRAARDEMQERFSFYMTYLEWAWTRHEEEERELGKERARWADE